MIEFDFLGKDSIRYYNCVPVEKQVFKNVNLFMKDKSPGDDLFDRLTVSASPYHIIRTHLTVFIGSLLTVCIGSLPTVCIGSLLTVFIGSHLTILEHNLVSHFTILEHIIVSHLTMLDQAIMRSPLVLFVLLDDDVEQASVRVDGRTHCQGVQNLQRIQDSAGAT